MKFSRLLPLFILFLSAGALCAKEFLDPAHLIEQGATLSVADYPDADDILLDNFVQVTYQPDGTSESWDDTAVKIFTEKGRRDNRILQLSYNISYGTSTFTQVELIKPDGSVIPVDIEAQSKEIINPSQMSANIYNPHSKILKLSVPGLEVGDILRYVAHEVHTKTVVPDTWSDYQVFESTSPIKSLTYQVFAPKARPLSNIALKAEIPGTVHYQKEEQDNLTIHTWKVQDVPRMFPEPGMPAAYTVVQRLLISTIADWKDISMWYWDLCLPRLQATTPAMKEKTQELTQHCTSIREKVEAIFNFVSQDIRYMGITTEEEAPGYEPHDVKITFENRYGVCRDKAALLVAMLQLADVEAFPVIIMAGPKKDPEVPQPFFNHAVTAALDEEGNYILMDATDENTKDIFPAYLQNMSYLVARPEGETLLTTPVIPATDNLMKIHTTASLSHEGRLQAESSLLFEGINDTAYRNHLAKLKQEERFRFFEGHLTKNLPTATLQEINILPEELRDTSQPLTVNLRYLADNMMVKGEQLDLLQLPRFGTSIGFANFLIGQTGLETRKYPLFTRMTAGIEETLELKLPQEHDGTILPECQPVETPELTWEQQLNQYNDTLSATNRVLIKTVEFSPDAYQELKRTLKEIEYNERKKLLFPHSPNSMPSDIRILESRNQVTLQDVSNWTETSYKKVQILTYAGKKKHAEIKLTYNPAWQKITLKSAQVTLRDGIVKTVTEDEINLMDASWAATAPRYPAEKILVINFPGVEIGSVLEYEIESEVFGKPFFSTTRTFNGTEPIDFKQFTLEAPEDLLLSIKSQDINAEQTTRDGKVVYTWTSEHQPALKKEDQLPEWWAFNPAVFLSSGTWSTYAEQLRTVLLQATQDQQETEKLANSLVKKEQPARERIEVLSDWVAEHITTAGPALTSLPLTAITPADRTLHDRYANSSDRAVVFYTLLKAAGFDPSFVLSGNLSRVQEINTPQLQVPQRTAFSAVLVAVEVDGQRLYFGQESQYAQPGTTGYWLHPMLDLQTEKTGILTVPERLAEQQYTHYNVHIDQKGNADIAVEQRFFGTAFEAFHRGYAESTPEERRRHYLETVATLSQSAKATSELETDYTSYPGIKRFSVHADRYGVVDGNFLYFTLPDGLNGLLLYRSREREYPLEWNDVVHTTIAFDVTLPEGYIPEIIPEPFTWLAPNDAGTITISSTYTEKDHRLHLLQKAQLNPALIQPEDYPKIMETGRTLAHPALKTIVLKKQ